MPLFRFHENRGKNIVLSENHQSAERMGNDRNGGIVLSSKPMVINWLYEVKQDYAAIVTTISITLYCLILFMDAQPQSKTNKQKSRTKAVDVGEFLQSFSSTH